MSTPFSNNLIPFSNSLPTIKGVLIHTYNRLKVFIFRAGKIIIAIVIILNLLNSIGIDGTFGHEDSESSVLATIGKKITPILYPLGIKQDNWPATVGLFTGIFAKEAVVGTLTSLYNAKDQETKKGQEDINILQGIKDAFSSIHENLLSLGNSILDPLGISSINEETSNEVEKFTTHVMVKRFDGKVGAFAYLLFVLLYIPCLAAVATIYRETNIKWTIFIVGYTVCIAWTTSTLFYQIATFNRHPGLSMAWIAGIVALLLTSYYIIKKIGKIILAKPPTKGSLSLSLKTTS